MNQHATAVIHQATRIADDVTVGAYSVVEDGVEIGSGTVIREHVVIRAGTVIGKGCVIDAGTVLGGLPQDLSFDPKTPSGVIIGEHVTFREAVTINRATGEGQFTRIGNNCYFMATSHVGHDCIVGDNVVVANSVLLAGKVTVGSHSFIGGSAAIHQFCRVGESAMIGGLARVAQDVPPYCMMAERNELVGLNLVGLRRRGLPRETIMELKKLYHIIYSVDGRPTVLARAAVNDNLAKTEEGLRFLEFMAADSRKQVMRPRYTGGRHENS